MNTLRDYIPINPILSAQTFSLDIGLITYNFKVNYNELGDFYTIDIYDFNNQPIVLGEKLTYGLRLWSGIDNPNLPSADLVPFDEAGNETRVSQSNLNRTLFLFIDDIGGDLDAN